MAKKTLQVRLSEADYASLVERAGGEGKRLSEFCRAALLGFGKYPAIEPSPAVKEANKQIELLAKRETEAKRHRSIVHASGITLCPTCTRRGCATCDACRAAVAKASPSAAQVFSHLVEDEDE